MTTQAEANYRRDWIKRYIRKNAPVTVAEVADRAGLLALDQLPDDDQKLYWRISKDIQKLRRSGEIDLGMVVFKKPA